MLVAQMVALLIPVGMFAGAALVVSLLGLLQYRLAGRATPETRAAASIFLIGVGATLSVALTARSLNESGMTHGQVVLYEDYASGFAASRWLSLALLAAAVVEIIRGWTRQRARPVPDPAWPVFFSLLLFYAGTLLIQAFVSEHSGFSHQELYVPIMLLAICYQRIEDLALVLSAAKAAIAALTVGSLLGIVLHPDFVLHRPDIGVIPGIDGRLFGLTPHANTLGPIALLGLLLEFYSPYRRMAARLLNLGACLAVLLLAQSRTAWAAGALIAVMVLVPLAFLSQRHRADTRLAFHRAVWTVLVCIGLLLAATAVFTAFSGSDYLLRKTELGTLNGRFQIWDITLQAWRENILFGYGPEVWGPERRLRFNMFHVGQAHNQFVQTLGEAGLAGLAILVIYLLTLTVIASRRFTASKGLILALLALVLARCVTESPMRSEGLLSWSTFLHVLLVLVACHHLRMPAASRWPVRTPAAAPACRSADRTGGYRVSIDSRQGRA